MTTEPTEQRVRTSFGLLRNLLEEIDSKVVAMGRHAEALQEMNASPLTVPAEPTAKTEGKPNGFMPSAIESAKEILAKLDKLDEKFYMGLDELNPDFYQRERDKAKSTERRP